MSILHPQDINNRQNDPEHLHLLEAADVAHARAHRIETARWLTIAGLTTTAFVVLFLPDFAGFAALVGVAAAILTEGVWPKIAGYQTRQAALIQEMFDTSLFKLEWADELGDKLTASELSHLQASYRGTYPKQDWYMDVRGVPSPIAELSCQRENLLWDTAIRQEWAWRLTAIVTGVASLGFIIALIFQWAVFQLLTWYYGPMAPLILALLFALLTHRKVANNKQQLRVDLDRELHRLDLSTITAEDVLSLGRFSRVLQSKIFETRCETARVPSRFYGARRQRYEGDHEAESRAVKAVWTV